MSLFSNIFSELPDLLSELNIEEPKGCDAMEGPEPSGSYLPVCETYNGFVVGAAKKGGLYMLSGDMKSP